MTLLARLITILAILRIVFGRNTVYEVDGVQQGGGTLFAVFWILIVYTFIWLLFGDKLPDWLVNFGYMEGLGVLMLSLLLWVETASFTTNKENK